MRQGPRAITEDEHEGSDVIAGALVGEISGRLVLRWSERDAMPLTLSPLVRNEISVCRLNSDGDWRRHFKSK